MPDTLHEDKCIFVAISRWILLRMRNISDKTCQEHQTAHFMFNKFFPRQSCHVRHNGQNYCTAGQATAEDMAHAHCTLYSQCYKPTLRISNTYCFSTAKIFARTHFSDTLHIHCLSCSYLLFSPLCIVKLSGRERSSVPVSANTLFIYLR